MLGILMSQESFNSKRIFLVNISKVCYLYLATTRRLEVSSIFKDTTAEFPFSDFKTCPSSENQTTYPALSPTII